VSALRPSGSAICIAYPDTNRHGSRIRPTIDLHCHILPGIDDGARDIEDAIAMARQAQTDGIQRVCATPHIRHDHDVRIHELPARLSDLSTAIRATGCRTHVLPGGEVAVTALEGLDDDEVNAVTLGGGGRWVLLEPAPGPLDDSLDKAVDRLRQRGFRALVAHPERHLAPDLVERLRRLVQGGALVQATAAFFVEGATRPGMLALAREGVIHVLGSDAHTSHAGRRVALRAALDALRAVPRTASHVQWIAETAPEAIVHGEELEPPF
jgi:protein-tyrosine phosphatase